MKKVIIKKRLNIFILISFFLVFKANAQPTKTKTIYDKPLNLQIIFYGWDNDNGLWKNIMIKDSLNHIKKIVRKENYGYLYFDEIDENDLSPDGKYAIIATTEIGFVDDGVSKQRKVEKNRCAFLDIVNYELDEIDNKDICDGEWKEGAQHIWMYGDGEDSLNLSSDNSQQSNSVTSDTAKITSSNVSQYNEQAYNLQQQGKYQEAADILEKVIQVAPNRVVAYLNLADAYWGLNEKDKAKENYQKYVELMKSQHKDLSKIPQYVYDRIK